MTTNGFIHINKIEVSDSIADLLKINDARDYRGFRMNIIAYNPVLNYFKLEGSSFMTGECSPEDYYLWDTIVPTSKEIMEKILNNTF